jgi:hypothetical protein
MKTLDYQPVSTMKGDIGISITEDKMTGDRVIRACPVRGLSLEGDKKMVEQWGRPLDMITLMNWIVDYMIEPQNKNQRGADGNDI